MDNEETNNISELDPLFLMSCVDVVNLGVQVDQNEQRYNLRMLAKLPAKKQDALCKVRITKLFLIRVCSFQSRWSMHWWKSLAT